MTGGPGFVLLQAQGESPFAFLVPMALIFVIFYLLLIRPQARRQKEHEAMLKAVERGDSVVTTGGLHGKVTGVTDDVLTLEIAATKTDRVRVKVDRSRIERRLEKGKGGEGA